MMSDIQTTAPAGKVTTRLEDGIAILEINNPPVNAGSLTVRAGLLEGIRAAVREGVRGAVVIGAGRSFVAGSDLKEFGQPLAAPELPDVIRAIEEAPFPVVAALHGVALGGGLELALGCDWRIASPGTKVGLPEVSLGMVPGAGGSQRLPRLVGRVRAIALICDSRRIEAREAAKIGLLDAVAEGDLLAAAKAFLAGRGKRRAIELPAPAEKESAVDAAAAAALKRGKGRPNIDEAIRLIRLCGTGDAQAELSEERAVFQRLRVGPDAFALRHLFFSERRAASVDGLDSKFARPITRVGVVGGGTMGQGIAKALLAADLPVILSERDAAARDQALARIGESFAAMVAKGRLTDAEAAARQERLVGTVGTADLAACDLVIEAVYEDMDLKREILADLEAVLVPEAIIATNTSYLDIDAMVSGLADPGRFLGLHFFSPADVMKLLEIVRAEKTSDSALATGLALAKRLGKQPVVARVSDGFIGNRIYAAYRRRAELLVLDGAAPEAVDAAARDFGLAMGPFEVADLSGLDIAWAMRKRQATTRDPAARYVAIPDRLCEAGRLGRKAGRGWYDYAGGRGVPDREVAAIIAAERQAAGSAPVAFDAETLQRQLLAAIVNEAACVVEDGIAQRASDIDVTFANGYGFPRWRGGPLYWAAEQDSAQLDADLDALAAAIGHGHRRGPVRAILSSQYATRAGA